MILHKILFSGDYFLIINNVGEYAPRVIKKNNQKKYILIFKNMRGQFHTQKNKEFKRIVESEVQRKTAEKEQQNGAINQTVDELGQTSERDFSAELNSDLNAAVIDLRIGKHNE